MTNRHWLASYGSIPKEINPDAYRSVTEMMEQAMKRFAERPAMRCAGQTLSYADLDRLSRDFAAYLQNRLGVKKGDRIAVMTPNLLVFPIAFLGIIRAGAVQVNVSQEERHRATLGDLLGFIQKLACEVVLAPDKMVERGGEEAAGNVLDLPCSAQAFDGSSNVRQVERRLRQRVG